jgi:hypothetical protein
MTDIVTTKEEMYKLLIKLMLDNFITFEDLDYCFEYRQEEFKMVMDIFDLKNTRDQELALGLIGTLAQEQEHEVMETFRRVYGCPIKIENFLENFPRSDLELLLSVCRYKPSFYSLALGICKDIKSMLEVKTDISDTENKNTKMEYKIVEVTPKYTKFIILDRIPAKASAAGSDDIPFKEIPIPYEGFSGKLRFMKEPPQKTYYEFEFDEYQYIIPFELEIYFTTICGKKKKHKIKIYADKGHTEKMKEENKTKIKSDTYYNVDLSGGIETNCEIIIKHLNS